MAIFIKVASSGFQVRSSIYHIPHNKTFFNTTTSTTIPVLQYCNYLLKMGRMDEEQAIFDQLTLSDLKKWTTTALKRHTQV